MNDPAAPLTLSNPKYDSIWDLSLEDAEHITLENSKVMRSLGGRFSSQGSPSGPQVGDAPTGLQSNPGGAVTTFDPAIVETNPEFGVEGGLSAYDAMFNSSYNWAHVNEPQNVARGYQHRRHRRADHRHGCMPNQHQQGHRGGRRVSLTNTATYFDSEQRRARTQSRQYRSVRLGLQQRLLRGGGLLFNEIDGPTGSGAGAGLSPVSSFNFRGVMIARINMDISLTQFEIGVPQSGRATWKTLTGNCTSLIGRSTPPRSAATAL